ncbi:MAG TPA: acyl-CoA dehydrogenase family protein [Polyangiaceae bacterium]|jgi:alkylation response protein AidB-like acyl-CoA dehydrogenase|nr:acyl-CoA dehydrogenase family protein [Polyangiaceae bacterium]
MRTERRLIDASLASEVGARREASRRTGSGSELLAALRWLRQPDGPLARIPDAQAPDAEARVIASLAGVDMSVAFSHWAHQMVVTYVAEADDATFRRAWGERLRAVEVVGSTALAASMTSHVTGAALPIEATERGGELELTGPIAWASNLFRPQFLLVTATERPGKGRAIVALRGSDPRIQIAPFPDLLDLQATASSSIRLDGARVRPDDVVAVDFERFVHRVRPRFLLWQASFCWGLAAQSLSEAASRARSGVNEVFAPDHQDLTTELDRIEHAIVDALADDAVLRAGPSPLAPPSIRAVVKLRLDAARLAGEATRLEAKVVGGRGYVVHSATARRQREAAFLPIQSPTEGQLRWELSRSI